MPETVALVLHDHQTDFGSLTPPISSGTSRPVGGRPATEEGRGGHLGDPYQPTPTHSDASVLPDSSRSHSNYFYIRYSPYGGSVRLCIGASIFGGGLHLFPEQSAVKDNDSDWRILPLPPSDFPRILIELWPRCSHDRVVKKLASPPSPAPSPAHRSQSPSPTRRCLAPSLPPRCRPYRCHTTRPPSKTTAPNGHATTSTRPTAAPSGIRS